MAEGAGDLDYQGVTDAPLRPEELGRIPFPFASAPDYPHFAFFAFVPCSLTVAVSLLTSVVVLSLRPFANCLHPQPVSFASLQLSPRTHPLSLTEARARLSDPG